MEEIWKDIKDFEGLYQISNFGKVKNLRTNRILKNKKDKDGYLYVILSKKSKIKALKIHRLVGMAFISNIKNKPQINHIDGNKENNCVDNLEWVTCSENQYHAFKIGLKPKNFNHPFSKFTKEDILYIRNNYQKNKKGFGIRTLARKYGVCDSTIRQIVVGITYKDIN